MAQSLSNVLLHIVFSTKDRYPFIEPDFDEELHGYLASICNGQKCPALKVGGTNDHVHIACRLSRTIKIAELLEEIKRSSSKWVKTKGGLYRKFGWQNGYGAFSIGPSQLPALIRYIENQREHHRTITFQEEYRKILQKYNIEWDERYVWD